MSGSALMLVLCETPKELLSEFHDWYDNEHAPARLQVPGIATARRYENTDSPLEFLAYYDLDSLQVLEDEHYKALRTNGSQREQDLLSQLSLNRRMYEQLPTPQVSRAEDLSICGAVLMGVWWTPPVDQEQDFHDWYNEEHLPRQMAVPGWLRARRFERVEGAGPKFLALHDLASTKVFETPEYQHVIDSPWRDRVSTARLEHERRLFRLWRRFDETPAAR